MQPIRFSKIIINKKINIKWFNSVVLVMILLYSILFSILWLKNYRLYEMSLLFFPLILFSHTLFVPFPSLLRRIFPCIYLSCIVTWFYDVRKIISLNLFIINLWSCHRIQWVVHHWRIILYSQGVFLSLKNHLSVNA